MRDFAVISEMFGSFFRFKNTLPEHAARHGRPRLRTPKQGFQQQQLEAEAEMLLLGFWKSLSSLGP